ncbi:C-type lectin domain-containing protein [Archangium violaceum]|uniref:C-type lectin domain-containing protein n=1 Tax=Archangium violaceum TaxID=83451 RepID=UPI00194DB1CA|nr:C-type lectin domain-containing protein [Archangium violaceum]QRN94517.1 C-type lectin domain-containing protein [Archangium violaceum]
MSSDELNGTPGFSEETLGEVQQKIAYNGHDYIFATTRKTWAQAAESCALLGYGLVTINNSAEDEWLKSNLSSTEIWWIGYNDRSVEGSWRWSTGTSFYANWSPGEPNNAAGNEDCAVKASSGTYVGLWNDEDCNKQFAYVCESIDSSVTVNYFNYSASNTASATQNTVNVAVTLQAGQTLTAGTCGISGASGSGDTYLRLYGPNGQQVAYNDDACGGVSSNFSYTVPTGGGGTYVINAGCYSSGSCSGRVGYTAITVLGRFARYCGKVNNRQSPGGIWAPDPDCSSGCNIGGISYCKKFWPGSTGIRQVSVSSKPNNVWANAGCAPVVDDWDGNDEFECIADSNSVTITYANVPVTYETSNGVLRFNSADDLYAVINQLEADYETYNTNYENQYPNLTAEQMDVVDEQNNFDEFVPYKNLERQLSGFTSKRSRIEVVERTWLANDMTGTDPDSLDITFDDAENTLFNSNYELKIGQTVYRMTEYGLTEVGGAQTQTAAAALSDSCPANPNSSEKPKTAQAVPPVAGHGTAAAELPRAQVVAFSDGCITNKKVDAPFGPIDGRTYKLKVAIHSILIRTSVKAKVVAYKQKSGGGRKRSRDQLAISIGGTLYAAGCTSPTAMGKANPASGFKKRRELKVRREDWGITYRTKSGELSGRFDTPSGFAVLTLR